MQTIVPHLWFDTEAKEAAEFYTSLLEKSEVTNVTTLRDTPSGDCDVVSFDLAGQPFQAISAGPLFKFNPSISFRIDCETSEEVDQLWNRLHDGGSALMPLDSYPFSERYGWLQDRYGLSWQIMHTTEEISQKVVPSLMFVGDVCGKAEEAIKFYASVFKNSEVGEILRYGAGAEPEAPESVQYAPFSLEGYQFAAMESAGPHEFSFNEAISLMVYCDTQEQIDYFWERLSAVPESEQCGWLKDRFGVSWQIVPQALDKMIEGSDEETLARVTQAFLQMKKFDVAKLEEAYAGR
jgi:predicted 3-demethylubiquinone-9 3-methyltransferase (glyoxalase superfamily)